jgi:hypothetical protein
MSQTISELLAVAAKVATPVPRKTAFELFIDFLHEEGLIISAGSKEVEAEGHDLVRFFRPEGGLTEEHFNALVEIDPLASEVLARAVVGRMVIDQGFRPIEVYRAATELGHPFWVEVPHRKSFEDASKDVSLTIYRQREKQGRSQQPEINPHGDWSVIVVRQGRFTLTPLARKVFPVIYSEHLKGIPVNEDYVRKVTGIHSDRIDRCLRTSKIWKKVVGPCPGKKGFWGMLP